MPLFSPFKHFPLLKHIILNLPPWLSLLTSPESLGILMLKNTIMTQLDSFLANPSTLTQVSHPIIYHRLLDPEITEKAFKGLEGRVRLGKVNGLPSRKSLYEEAQALFIAGSDTVGNTLSVGSFHILNNPAVYERLVRELRDKWADVGERKTYQELEGLPYLVGFL